MPSIGTRAASFGQTLSSESIAAITNGTARGLTVPSTAKAALITASLEAVRYRTDGTDPTSTVGHPLPVDSAVEVFGEDMHNVRFISVSATNAQLFVTYYAT